VVAKAEMKAAVGKACHIVFIAKMDAMQTLLYWKALPAKSCVKVFADSSSQHLYCSKRS
jgi:hypothetical protein